MRRNRTAETRAGVKVYLFFFVVKIDHTTKGNKNVT